MERKQENEEIDRGEVLEEGIGILPELEQSETKLFLAPEFGTCGAVDF